MRLWEACNTSPLRCALFWGKGGVQYVLNTYRDMNIIYLYGYQSICVALLWSVWACSVEDVFLYSSLWSVHTLLNTVTLWHIAMVRIRKLKDEFFLEDLECFKL